MSDETHDEPFRVFATEAEFRELIESEVTKARKTGEQRGKRQTQGLSAAEKAELDELRQEREEAEEERLKEAQRWQELDAKRAEKHQKELQERDQRIATFRDRLRHDRCHLELVRAASPHAYNPEQVARLLSDRLTLSDDGDAVVVDTSGQVVEGVTPAQLVEEFLNDDANANLVKSAADGGGSRAKGSNGKASPTEAAKLKTTLDELKQKAIDSGHPGQFASQIMQVRRQLDALNAES